jgi:hypothetical protein
MLSCKKFILFSSMKQLTTSISMLLVPEKCVSGSYCPVCCVRSAGGRAKTTSDVVEYEGTTEVCGENNP